MTEPTSFSQMVVVGSSAGGIEALSALVHGLPTGFPAPIVVAQHLDPSRESRLGDILSRTSTLPVRTLAEYERLEPGVVYVVPPNRDVEITDHDIRLQPGSGRSRPSIDHLFSSAADLFGEDLFAVVLTGTGNDGAAGALEVRQAGGTVIIQDPSTASFPALPRSLAPSSVDFVVPLEEIASLLQRLVGGTIFDGSSGEEDALTRLLRLLRERHGIDFHSYKQTTIMRRIQRRLAVTGSNNVTEYLRYVQQNPEEQHALIASFLIKVTRFFRDPDLYAALRERVLPDIVATARERDHTIRFWSAGCATGEEAYSLAILLADYLGDELEQFHVRIFATDLDADAITFARQGLYSAGSLVGLDQPVIDQYFDRVDSSYQIAKRIRALMVFGQHDLGERAPFPRVDLVLCRNVLIYFTSDLQRRILQLFGFSLRDGGYLILGKSETTTPFAEAFSTEDARLKIYRRRGDRRVIPTTPLRDMAPPSAQRITPVRPSLYGRALTPQPPAQQHEQAYGLRTDGVLFDLPVGVVVIDRRYDVQYINDAARTLLGIHTSAVGDDLVHLTQTVPAAELRALIDRALTGETDVSGTLAASDGSGDHSRYLQVACSTEPSSGSSPPRVTLCITNISGWVEERQRLQDDLQRSQQAQERAEAQQTRLTSTNRDLLATNQQLTREIAELRSQNEEFLVGNEELQAATEEVETLNEELQATVEELNTTNDDLQTRNVEIQDLAFRLETARARLQNVLNSLSEAILVVDRQGKTILTNSRYEELFAAPLESLPLLSARGRPLLEDDRPHRRGARGESFQMVFARTMSDGALRRYEAIGQPIQGDDDEVWGVLLIRELPAGEAPS